jgi:hypothetical protein
LTRPTYRDYRFYEIDSRVPEVTSERSKVTIIRGTGPMSKVACLTGAIFSVYFLSSWAAAQTLESIADVYSIQINSYFDRTDAESRCEELAEQGLTRAFIIEDPPLQRVLWGRFDVHMDAVVQSHRIREDDPGARPEVMTVSLGEAVAPAPSEIPVVAFFGLASEAGLAQATEWRPPVHDVRILNDAPTLVPVREGVMMARGPHWISSFAVEGRRRERADPLESLLTVARSDMSAGLQERLQACWDSVQALRADGSHEDAYMALCEMESLYPRGSEPWVRCAAERVRLLLEIAVGQIPWQMPELPRSGSHRYGDVRSAAEQVLVSMSGESGPMRIARTSVEVAVVESYFYERNFEETLRRGEDIISRCGDDPLLQRDVALANLRLGQLFYLEDHWEAAKDYFEAAVAIHLPPNENYEGLDVESHAVGYLVQMARQEGDWEAMERHVQHLEALCPWNVATHCFRYQLDQRLTDN